MSYQIAYIKPHPKLADLIEFIVYFDGHKDYFPDRMIPSTYVHLVINLNSPLQLKPLCEEKRACTIYNGWVQSLHEWPFCVKPEGNVKFVSIRFKACAAYSLLLRPMSDLSNRIIQAEEVELPDFESLHAEIKNTDEVQKIECLVNEYLISNMKPEESFRPRVFCAMENMKKLNSEANLQDLAREAGVSLKHLNTLFHNYIGLSPKKFGCIMRFNEMLQYISKHRNSNWLDVVHKHGFSDHSHFIKDFKKFTGLTPTEFVNEYHLIDNNLFKKNGKLDFGE